MFFPNHILFLSLTLLQASTNALPHPERQPLNQKQVCSYQRTSRSVACKCENKNIGNSLDLDLEWYFLPTENEAEIDHIVIEFCEDLLISLDLTHTRTSNVHLKFSNCGKVQVENIKSDPTYSGDQTLSFSIKNTDKFMMQNQTVKESITISATNVKELMMYQNTFYNISGLTVEKADKVFIKDCVFYHTTPGSISIDSVKKVEIVSNQFSIDTLEVVTMKKSTNFYITGNNLIDKEVRVNWVTNSSDLDTAASASSLPESLMLMSNMSSASPFTKSDDESSSDETIVGGPGLVGVLIRLGLVVLSGVFIYVVCYRCGVYRHCLGPICDHPFCKYCCTTHLTIPDRSTKLCVCPRFPCLEHEPSFD